MKMNVKQVIMHSTLKHKFGEKSLKQDIVWYHLKKNMLTNKIKLYVYVCWCVEEPFF